MTGLTDEQVKERIEAGQVNADENPNTRTYKQIIKENTLTFFNFLNLVLLVLVLMVGSFKNAFFVCIIIINTLIGIAQEIRAKKTIDKLAILTAKKICRDPRGEKVDGSYGGTCYGRPGLSEDRGSGSGRCKDTGRQSGGK